MQNLSGDSGAFTPVEVYNLPSIGQLFQYGRAAWAVVMRLFMVTTKPVVLTTDVVTRRNMGERYLTTLSAWGGFLLILGVTWLTSKVSGTSSYSYDYYYERSTFHPAVSPALIWSVGVLWMICYVAGYAYNRVFIEWRKYKNIPWHSYCYGEWSLRKPAPWIQRLILVGLAVLFWALHLYLFAGLMLLSIHFSILTEREIANRLRAAILDIHDQRIASEHLQQALDCRPANETEGFVLSLPKYVAEFARKTFLRPAEAGRPVVSKGTPV
ncbi:MAG: hypothetical protein QM770_01070 [Tepidisphaeraceae bacterium]